MKSALIELGFSRGDYRSRLNIKINYLGGAVNHMVRKETFPHELIGEEIEVIDSKNKSNAGIRGKSSTKPKRR